MLQAHLAKVKLAHAEREAALKEELASSERARRKLEGDLASAADELELCWAHVDQLKLETTNKWHIEERDDWRALTASVQEDRTKLQRENARLAAEIARLTGDPSAAAAAADDAPEVAAPISLRLSRDGAPATPTKSKSPGPTFAMTATPRHRKIRLPKPSFRREEAPGLLEMIFFGRKRRRFSSNPILSV